MTNLQKYGQLHKILAEAAVYRRAVGKLELTCSAARRRTAWSRPARIWPSWLTGISG